MIRSFICAILGIAATVKSERNMRIHLAAAVAVVVLGAWLGLDGREWAAIVICCALVMSLECLNTAVSSGCVLRRSPKFLGPGETLPPPLNDRSI